MHKHKAVSAFTIVELLIVIVIIGILAAITIVSYSGVTGQARTAALQSDLNSNSRKLQLYFTQYGSYPTALDGNNCPSAPTADTNYCLKLSGSNSFSSYTATTSTYALKISNSNTMYAITESSAPFVPMADGTTIQTITTANCPIIRTRAVDARDNRTYWVQKLADGKCWMLTNLGYSGGGTNTYGDVKTLTNGTGGSTSYTVASYYVVPSTTNFTTEPTSPSTSTNGTGQYGYLYNWCGAMGAQATGACANTSTPTPDVNISVCPSGWRLPVGNGNDYSALSNALILGPSTPGLITFPWLGQYSGFWNGSFSNQGSDGWYWSSSQQSSVNAYLLFFDSSSVGTSDYRAKNRGHAVRCIAV